MEYAGKAYRIVVLDYRKVYLEERRRWLCFAYWHRHPTNHLSADAAWEWFGKHIVGGGWTMAPNAYR